MSTCFPALEAWRAELRRSERTRFTFDWLWRAACAEAWAEELVHLAPDLAARFRKEAQRVVQEAAREEARGAA